MHTKQRGVTFIGWLVLLAPLALVVYAGIRLTPIFLNYMNVSRSLEAVASEFKAEDTNFAALQASVGKHFNIEGIEYPKIADIGIKRNGHAWEIEATYDDQAPFIANVSIQVSFNKVVTIGTVGND